MSSWQIVAQAAQGLFAATEKPDLMRGPQGVFTFDRFLAEARRFFAGEHHLAKLRYKHPQAVEACYDGDRYRFDARGDEVCTVERSGARWAVVCDLEEAPTFAVLDEALEAAYRKTHFVAYSRSSPEDVGLAPEAKPKENRRNAPKARNKP